MQISLALLCSRAVCWGVSVCLKILALMKANEEEVGVNVQKESLNAFDLF